MVISVSTKREYSFYSPFIILFHAYIFFLDFLFLVQFGTVIFDHAPLKLVLSNLSPIDPTGDLTTSSYLMRLLLTSLILILTYFLEKRPHFYSGTLPKHIWGVRLSLTMHMSINHGQPGKYNHRRSSQMQIEFMLLPQPRSYIKNGWCIGQSRHAFN